MLAISKEISRSHTAGPFRLPPFHNFHCSPLGAVPKKDGTFRIILGLSSPRGSSINEFISKTDFSVKYSSFDDAVELVRSLGPHCFMAKIDIKHAFRLCPVRPCDYHLLGMFWQGQYFVDTRLPFGFRSSPYIFNTFADALAWIIITVCGIATIIHYLDDFFIAASNQSTCHSHVHQILDLFSELGVPIAEDKLVTPTTSIAYLGIEIVSGNMTVRLPAEKLHILKTELLGWTTKNKTTKKDLLSIIGKLAFAAKVVKPGRIFMRRLIDLSTTVNKLHHWISINKEARLDFLWWHSFIESWNGVRIILDSPITSDELHLYTDASGTLGFGAVFASHWFSVAWPSFLLQYSINFKELNLLLLQQY